MQSKTKLIARLLTSKGVLRQQVVSRVMDIQPQSARNLLARWSAEGLIERVSFGVYISKFAKDTHNKALLESVRQKVGEDLILVGGSCWESAGWASSPTLFIATSVIPSKVIPKINGVEIYPVGIKQYVHLLQKGIKGKVGMPPALHPVDQMLWWMEEKCPVTMPAPSRIKWDAVMNDANLVTAMRSTWPEFKTLIASDIPGLYSMVHMDRLTQTIPGSAEPLDETDEQDAHGETDSL
jgi:hypothetical protein